MVDRRPTEGEFPRVNPECHPSMLCEEACLGTERDTLHSLSVSAQSAAPLSLSRAEHGSPRPEQKHDPLTELPVALLRSHHLFLSWTDRCHTSMLAFIRLDLLESRLLITLTAPPLKAVLWLKNFLILIFNKHKRHRTLTFHTTVSIFTKTDWLPWIVLCENVHGYTLELCFEYIIQ